jgi:cold shock CspA family protein
VHYKSIEGNGFRVLSKGETVEYEVARREKGLAALHVKKSSRP